MRETSRRNPVHPTTTLCWHTGKPASQSEPPTFRIKLRSSKRDQVVVSVPQCRCIPRGDFALTAARATDVQNPMDEAGAMLPKHGV